MSYSSAPPESSRALLGGAREEEEDTEASAELYGEGQHRAQMMRSPAFDGEELLFASSAVARRGGARERRDEAPSSSRALTDDELEERSSSRLRGAQTNLRKRSSRDHGDAFKFLRNSSRLRRQPPALDAPLLGRAHRQRFVALPDDDMERVVGVYHQVDAGGASDPFSPEHRRCTCVCCCEKFDLDKVHSLFRDRLRARIALRFIDAVYVSGVAVDQGGGALAHSSNAYIFFSYGVVLIWGSCDPLEAAILKMTAPAMVEPHEIERDVFSYQNDSAVKSYIQNDVISIGRADNTNEKIKMAISHALAQSTKMSVLEERVRKIIIQILPIPRQLATSGHVTVSRQEVNMPCGKVFLQKTAVNLLDSVLDTPEYFWSQPDSLQLLYEKVGEYVELEPRIEVINQRFQLLHEMLELIRDVGNTNHSSRLEWIIIWLIVIEVIIGIVTIVSSLAFHGWGW